MRSLVALVALILLCGCTTGPAPTAAPPTGGYNPDVPTRTPSPCVMHCDGGPQGIPPRIAIDPTTTLAPTATPTSTPITITAPPGIAATATATRPPHIPTINPTQPQARSNPTRAQACEFIEQYAARLGMAFDPGAPVEATVGELQRRQGIDPAGHSGYGNFVGDQLRHQVRACLALR